MAKTEEIKKITSDLVNDFLTQLGLDADITVEITQNEKEADYSYLQVGLEGDNLGEIIGYRGRMLESVQTVLSMMVSKAIEAEGEEGKFRLILDVNQYKDQRADYLKNFALRAADQVKQSRQPMELDPMKPAERRIVHMALRDQEGIETTSAGEGEDRHIVIKPK